MFNSIPRSESSIYGTVTAVSENVVELALLEAKMWWNFRKKVVELSLSIRNTYII